ncbi:MAG: hypothetical protein MUF75_11210 [Bacteroidia bacterium]|nr:hypothetical protein [Bacteroidia bacterium]
MFSFLSFGINDVIDILLVAVILYLAYNLVKGTSAINIFIGLTFIYFTFMVLKAFDLKLFHTWQICERGGHRHHDCVSTGDS